ncbi:MAG TPA: hypothetical protein VF278_04660 [Pirellulales bacterium]
MKHVCVISCALAVCLAVSGCGGPPHVSPGNYRLINALRTATSSKQIDWVSESARKIEEGKANGTVSDAEYVEFQSIVRLARDGKWQEAEAETIRLAKGQKPTAEELRRVRK